MGMLEIKVGIKGIQCEWNARNQAKNKRNMWNGGGNAENQCGNEGNVGKREIRVGMREIPGIWVGMWGIRVTMLTDLVENCLFFKH